MGIKSNNSPFAKTLDAWPVARLRELIERAGPGDVKRALRREQLFPDDLAALIFPQAAPFLEDMAQAANLSLAAQSYLAALGLQDPDAYDETAAFIWLHALAVGYAPAYPTGNADSIRQDWPRIPLPDSQEVLEHSARLGRELTALLDPESPVPGVPAGVPRSELKSLAVIPKVGGGALNPDAGDLALTVGGPEG